MNERGRLPEAKGEELDEQLLRRLDKWYDDADQATTSSHDGPPSGAVGCHLGFIRCIYGGGSSVEPELFELVPIKPAWNNQCVHWSLARSASAVSRGVSGPGGQGWRRRLPSGLFTRFDTVVLVCEPARPGVRVYEQLRQRAAGHHLRRRVVGNKIAAQSWANRAVGAALAEQIDPDFVPGPAALSLAPASNSSAAGPAAATQRVAARRTKSYEHAACERPCSSSVRTSLVTSDSFTAPTTSESRNGSSSK